MKKLKLGIGSVLAILLFSSPLRGAEVKNDSAADPVASVQLAHLNSNLEWQNGPVVASSDQQLHPRSYLTYYDDNLTSDSSPIEVNNNLFYLSPPSPPHRGIVLHPDKPLGVFLGTGPCSGCLHTLRIFDNLPSVDQAAYEHNSFKRESYAYRPLNNFQFFSPRKDEIYFTEDRQLARLYKEDDAWKLQQFSQEALKFNKFRVVPQLNVLLGAKYTGKHPNSAPQTTLSLVSLDTHTVAATTTVARNITCLNCSLDGQAAAIVARNGTVSILDTNTLKSNTTLNIPDVQALKFSGDGNQLYITEGNYYSDFPKSVQTWDVRSEKCVRTLTLPPDTRSVIVRPELQKIYGITTEHGASYLQAWALQQK